MNALRETEAGLVAAIQQRLQLAGYIVLRVGQWRADKAGQTPGTPDLLVARPLWGVWVGLEVKTATGRLSPAQKALHEAGLTFVVRSPEEALLALRDTNL